jgi:hypothetical protein
MISETDLFVAYNGPSARFTAGVERFVRDSLVDVALANGALLSENHAGRKAQYVPDVQAASEDRDGEIQNAIETLQESGANSAFGADGKPKVRRVEKILGYNIDAADRDRVWDAMNAD